jgi:hypothetical protein
MAYDIYVPLCLFVHIIFNYFDNRVLRKIFGSRRDQVTGKWRRLHKEKFYAPYSSPNIIWVIKSRKMGWAGRVAYMEDVRNSYRVLVGKPEERRPLEASGVDGRIILKLIFEKYNGGMWRHRLDGSVSDQGQVAGFFECGDRPSGCIKCREFFD